MINLNFLEPNSFVGGLEYQKSNRGTCNPSFSANVEGPYRYWKVLEIKNTTFQNLESFGKENGFSVWLWKMFGFLFAKLPMYSKMDVA